MKKIVFLLLFFLLSQSAQASTLMDVRKRMEQMRVDLIKDELLVIKETEKLNKEDSDLYEKQIPLKEDVKKTVYERGLLDSLTDLIVKLGGEEQLSDSDMKQLEGLVPPIDNETR